MKIRFLENNEIDKAKWDKCISSAFNGIIYAYSWYLDIVSPEWAALVAGDYETVFPLPQAKKAGILYLRQPLITQQLGIFSQSGLNTAITNSFLEAIPKKFKLTDIHLNTFNRADHTAFQIKLKPTYQLDLISPFSQISGGFHQNTVRNIKKAVKNNITTSRNLKPETLVRLFQANKGEEIKDSIRVDYLMITHLLYQIIAKGHGKLWGAFTPENNLCAAAFFAEINKKAIYLLAATDAEAKKSGAMALLVNNYIQK
ncbi:MAG: hypothetical protein KKA07_04535, partial [Bacteroidetes bacterium]|nr:hypothetical protein [Bacteroidota bacterium]